LERMLIVGVEMVARSGAGGDGGDATGPISSSGTGDGESGRSGQGETWKRVRVVPGIELHLQSGLPRPAPEELRQWIEALERALRRNV